MSDPVPYKIPLVDLPAQYRKIRAEIRQAIDEVADSQQFILGPAVRRFEDQMAGFLKTKAAIGVASGTDALLLALTALDIGPGDGVLVPPFTFFSSVSSITRLGATPLFVDIEPEGYLIDPAAAAEFLSARCRREGEWYVEPRSRVRVKALLPVHLFGRCCPMSECLTIAKKYRLRIVEDVAQACGALAPGERRFAGAIGDLGCFSFFPSKTLGGFGDGGLVTTDRAELAEKVARLRVHGESAKYRHRWIGINSRLDSLQAAVLTVKQGYLADWCDKRIARARHYHDLFTSSDLLPDNGISFPDVPSDGSHVFNNYVVRVQRRDELKAFLAARGIQSEIYYPLPLHLQECFAYLGYQKGDFPHAERAAAEVLALPIYPELTGRQQETVVQAIAEFYRG